jgi:hypothetical protein
MSCIEVGVWYAPPDTNLENLQRWLPKGIADRSAKPALRSTQSILASAKPFASSAQPTSQSVAATEKGVALSELLARVKCVIDRGLPDAVWV